MTLEQMVKKFRQLEHEITTFKEVVPKGKPGTVDGPSGAIYTPVAKATLLVERQALAFAIARELAKMPTKANVAYVTPTIRKVG